MYKLCIEDHFDAAHFLRDYVGPCARTHGHTWKVQISVKGTQEDLQANGILVDFKILKKDLKAVLNNFDHRIINDVDPFQQINPTAENLSYYIYNALKINYSLAWIRVWESPTAYCEYSKE